MVKDIDSIILDIFVYIEVSFLYFFWFNLVVLKEFEIEDDIFNLDGGEILWNKEGKVIGVMLEMVYFKIVWLGWVCLKIDKEGEDEVLCVLNEYSVNGYIGIIDMVMDEVMLNNIKWL